MSYRLHCGDYKDLIQERCDLILTSPPYNIGSKSPKKITNRKNGGFDSKSWGGIENYPDNLPEVFYQKEQYNFLRWCLEHLNKDGVIVYNHKPRHKGGRLIIPSSWFPPELVLYDKVIWDRGSTHNHNKSYLYDHHEELYIFRHLEGKPYFRNEDFFWKSDKNKGCSNIWGIVPDRSGLHNAPFPINLARQVIRLWSKPGGLVCDPYSGSGTTMIACLLEGRNFIGTEKERKYYELTLRRFRSQKPI